MRLLKLIVMITLAVSLSQQAMADKGMFDFTDELLNRVERKHGKAAA